MNDKIEGSLELPDAAVREVLLLMNNLLFSPKQQITK